MTQHQSPPPKEIITSEDVAEEMISAYAEKGFTLIFAEKVMRYDLTRPLPQVSSPPEVSYLTWNTQNIPAFFSAYEAAFRERPGFPGWSEEEWRDRVAGDPAFRPDLSLVALIHGQAAGFVTNEEESDNPGRGYLSQVGVHPQWRGQGLGSILVMRSLQAWQEARKEEVILHVNVNNPGAIRLYEQLGFVPVKLRGKFSRQ